MGLKNEGIIEELHAKFPAYGYWEIYWAVNDSSFLGKKRTITNRIKKLISTKNQTKRQELGDEAQELLDELYAQLKSNSAKLVDISRIVSHQ